MEEKKSITVRKFPVAVWWELKELAAKYQMSVGQYLIRIAREEIARAKKRGII